MEFGNKTKETIFNSSLQVLYRLNGLLEDCNYHKKLCRLNKLDYKQLKLWEDTIYILFDEISIKLDDEQMKHFNEELDKKFNIIIRKKTPRGIIKVINPKQFMLKWKQLRRIEQELRKIADKKGMLIPDKRTDFLAGTNI